MPKCYKTPAQKDHERLVRNISMIQGGRSNNQMCKLTTWSITKWNRYRQNPEVMPYMEMKFLCNMFNADFDVFLRGELKLS